MTNMRFLAEMFQGRYRFANVLQETWPGWNVIQMTDTFILPNCWTITPDDDGGHTMHEIIPMSLGITGFKSMLENENNGRDLMTYKTYPMMSRFSYYSMQYMNFFRLHYETCAKYDKSFQAWLVSQPIDPSDPFGQNFYEHFDLADRYFGKYTMIQKCHFFMLGVPILLLSIFLFFTLGMCCFCYCCCTGPSKRSKVKKTVETPKPANNAKSGKKRREKIE